MKNNLKKNSCFLETFWIPRLLRGISRAMGGGHLSLVPPPPILCYIQYYNNIYIKCCFSQKLNTIPLSYSESLHQFNKKNGKLYAYAS